MLCPDGFLDFGNTNTSKGAGHHVTNTFNTDHFGEGILLYLKDQGLCPVG